MEFGAQPEGAGAAPVALLLGAGELPLPRLRGPLISGAGLVIAADGGLRHAAALGLKPDLVVGDLDSASQAALAAFPNVPVLRFPRDKEKLDFELALDAAVTRGSRTVRALGVLGGRFDQSLAALQIAARAAATGVRLSLHGGPHEAHALTDNQSLRLVLPAGTTVSIVPLTETSSLTTSGLVFPLSREGVPLGTGLGVSNRVVGSGGLKEVSLTAHAGTVALLVEHGAEREVSGAGAREAIWGAQAERIAEALKRADPDLARLIQEVAYDDVLSRPGLDLRTRELIAVALLAALGATPELPTHLRGALRVGATESELRETLLTTAMFVGFPRALAAMRTLTEFLADRARLGKGEVE